MSFQKRASERQIQPIRCATCGRLLIGRYYMFRGRSEGFCADCMDFRSRCSSCGAPLEDNHWKLHDGRQQCNRCHSTAVYDVAEAQQLYAETVKGVAQQLGLRLQKPVEFRLLDAPTLSQLHRSGNTSTQLDEHPLGLYYYHGSVRAIYMLYGLPKLMFRITVAHEYAHAWQAEYCPTLSDNIFREGFAEWVAYHHLLWLGCSLAAERMLEEEHPYRPALERVLELERRTGIPGVIASIQRA
jgi:Protein of unknown function (DUF3633).